MKSSESLHSSWTPCMWCPPSPSETGWTNRDHRCPTAAPSVCLDPSLRPRYRKLCSFHQINLFFQSFVVKSGLSEKSLSGERSRWNTKYLMTLLVGLMKSGGRFFNTLMPLSCPHLFGQNSSVHSKPTLVSHFNICSCKHLCKTSVHKADRKMSQLVVVPAGVGVWTGTHRDLSAAYRCVDMADGMDVKLTDVLQPSDLTLTLLDVSVVCQEGSSVVTTAEDNICLSAGDSLLVPEQSRWVQLTDGKLTRSWSVEIQPIFSKLYTYFQNKDKTWCQYQRLLFPLETRRSENNNRVKI